MAKTKARARRPGPTKTSDAEIDRQGRVAEARQATLYKSGLVAVSARYDARSRRVMIEMSNRVLVGVPVDSIQSLRGAAEVQLAAVEVDAIGSSLRWDSLDADVSVLGILHKHMGFSALLREAGRAGGRASSEAKTAAARANGAKGGRPRKRTVT